jgi:DNA-binding FrmR family transcriptional regulator
MAKNGLHQAHAEITRRLRRAEGHVRSTIQMIADGRSCLDIAQQLQAIENAISSAKRALIHDHIDNCLEQTLGRVSGASRGPLEEFKKISKYL